MQPQPLNTEIGQINQSDTYTVKVFCSIPHGHPGVSIRRFRKHGKKLYPTDDGIWLNAKHLDDLIELLQAARGHHLSCQQTRAKVMKSRDEDYRRRNGASSDPFEPEAELSYSVLCEDTSPPPEPPKRLGTKRERLLGAIKRAEQKLGQSPDPPCGAAGGSVE